MATTSYHISPNGPRLCAAEKGLCPYGLAGEPHFGNINDAETNYAARMEQAFGTFPPTHERGTAYNTRMNAYSYREDAVEAVEAVRQTYVDTRQSLIDTKHMVKASAPVKGTLRVLRALRSTPGRAMAKADAFDAHMQDWARTAPERRAAQTARVKEKTNAVWTQAKTDVKSMPGEVAAQYNLMRAAARQAKLQPGPRPRTPKASNLRVGDYLEGGLRVARIDVSEDGNVSARLRSPAGTWAGKRTYGPDDRVAVKRWNKREVRKQTAGKPRALRDHPAFQRVKAVSAAQKQVFSTLRGVDQAKVVASHTPVREDSRLRSIPFATSAPVEPEQLEAINTLAGVSARRRRAAA